MRNNPPAGSGSALQPPQASAGLRQSARPGGGFAGGRGIRPQGSANSLAGRRPARVPVLPAAPPPPAGGDPPPEKGSLGTLALSVVIHGIILGVAVIWVVSTIILEKPPEAFAPPEKRVRLPAQLREQALSNARHDAAAPRPSYSRRLAARAPGPVEVPPMPEVDLKQMLPLDPGELVSDQISGMTGASGYGRGTGRGLGGGGGTGRGTGLAFFDIRDEARSVVIMIDVSQSMFSRTGDYDSSTRKLLREGRGQSFQVIRDEAIQLISSLGPDTRFGIIRWSGSARSWKPELVRATDAGKEEARRHIQEEIDANTAPPAGGRPGGTRHDYAIEELLRLNPETAFMLTDGNATASRPGGGMTPIPSGVLTDLLEKAREEHETIPRIHTIYYLTGADKPAEEAMLREIARKSKGRFRKVEAAGAAAAAKARREDDSRGRGRDRDRERREGRRPNTDR